MVTKAPVMRLSATPAPALLAAATLAALSGGRAVAADLDYGYGSAPPVISLPESKVEFGSGWYVRGDIGATRLPSISMADPTSTGQAPSMTLGSGSKLGYTASLGAGYTFNKWFRGDATFDFHQPLSVNRYAAYYAASTETCPIGYAETSVNSTTGLITYSPIYEACSSSYKAAVTSYDVLVNGYIDLGHWRMLTPYVGAGIGMSFGHYSTAVAYTNPDGSSYNTYFSLPSTGTLLHGYNDVRVSGNYYNFAFALMAGIAIDIYPHTKLDIGYRYIHLGEVLGANLATQEARLGLRYMIDN